MNLLEALRDRFGKAHGGHQRIVVCNLVLERLKNCHGVFENIIRITKSGCIMIGIPNLAHLINGGKIFLGPSLEIFAGRKNKAPA